MKIAIADLGTNTFNLLIRDLSTGELLYNGKLPVKLGKGGIHENRIADDAFARGVDAMVQHRNTANTFGVDRFFAFATAAVRTSSNGHEFTRAVFESTGIHVNVIDGLQEAQFIFEGVRKAIDLPDYPVMVMDIGGGSTEFVIGTKTEVLWFNSYKLGVSRLLEIFKPQDPATEGDALKIRQYILDETPDLQTAIAKYQPKMLIGSSGSFDTLYDIIAHRFNRLPLQLDQINGRFDEGELRNVATYLMSLSREERLVVPGMLEMRVDMIHLSGLQIETILNIHDFDSLRLSTYALKEGVIDAVTENPEKWHAS